MERKYEKWDFLTGSFSSFEIFEMVGFGGKRLSFLTSHFLAIKRGFVIKYLLISIKAFRKQILNNLSCRPGSCRAVGFLPRRFLDAHQKNHETPIYGKRYETPETARIRNVGGPLSWVCGLVCFASQRYYSVPWGTEKSSEGLLREMESCERGGGSGFRWVDLLEGQWRRPIAEES